MSELNPSQGNGTSSAATALARNAAGGKRTVPWRNLTQGPIPVLVGVALIWAFFQLNNPTFLTSRNLSNLTVQLAVITLISMAASLIIVSGQFDISLGAQLGVAAAVLAVLLSNGWPAWAAILGSIGAGVVLGFVQSLVVVYIKVPSFIVTLGGFLAFTGIQQQLIGNAGAIPINDAFVLTIANQYLDPGTSWALVAAVAVGSIALEAARRRAWTRAGQEPPSRIRSILTALSIPVAAAIVVAYFNSFSGVAVVVVLVLALCWALDWITQRTQFGRYLYATGGNTEAARRAGIPVRGITIGVLAMGGALAALAGIVSASRLYSVSADNGGGQLLLQAVAAAVIGGTSLFGGRGRVYSALLGSLVIVSISNGLDLMNQSTATTNVATGIILVLAVSIDALSRRGTTRT